MARLFREGNFVAFNKVGLVNEASFSQTNKQLHQQWTSNTKITILTSSKLSGYHPQTVHLFPKKNSVSFKLSFLSIGYNRNGLNVLFPVFTL